MHSYPVEEKVCYAKVINDHFKNDADLGDMLPLNPDNDDIFSSCTDGLLMIKLINTAVEGTIDMRAVNKKENMNIY